MGGRAFNNVNLTPIRRTQIIPTISHIVKMLDIDGFTERYALANLLGSAGKQDQSNDLDFALNNKIPKFIGEDIYPVFNFKNFALNCRKVLGDRFINTDGINGGQINTVWPISGCKALGYIQVDFISGYPRWLKFTHWSPGKDTSPWKGVLISTLLGVMVKRRQDFHLKAGDKTVAKVGLYYDLEKGLHRRWFIFDSNKMAIKEVNPDTFESAINGAPRFPRIGYIDDPETVLRIIFNQPVQLNAVSTFEDLVKCVYTVFPSDFEEIKRLFITSFMRSGGKRFYSLIEIENSDVWNGHS